MSGTIYTKLVILFKLVHFSNLRKTLYHFDKKKKKNQFFTYIILEL